MRSLVIVSGGIVAVTESSWEAAARIIVTWVPFVIAVVVHEVSHGLVAEKLGDPTARDRGRITLNPLRHIDPFLTIIVPAALILSGSPVVFGGAKPVPVNPAYFRNPRRGMLWVAAAGPISNFLLLLASLAILVLAAPLLRTESWFGVIVFSLAFSSALVNAVLCLFNLVPIPPLDGGRIAVGVLPLSAARILARTERFGLLLVVLLLFSGAIDAVLGPAVRALLDFAHWLVG